MALKKKPKEITLCSDCEPFNIPTASLREDLVWFI